MTPTDDRIRAALQELVRLRKIKVASAAGRTIDPLPPPWTEWDIAWAAAEAALQEAPASQPAPIPLEPVAWRDHVEQRLLTWRQSFMNKSGDQLALDDFMDKESLADLIDFVCDEYAQPISAQPPSADAAEFCCEHAWNAAKMLAWKEVQSTPCDCDHNESCLKCWPMDFRAGGKWSKYRAAMGETHEQG